jgi:membrane protein
MVTFYIDHIKLQLPTFDTERLTGIVDKLLHSKKNFAFIWLPFLFWWGSFIFDIFERIIERAFRIKESRKYWKAKLLHFAIILAIAFIVFLFSVLINIFNLIRTTSFIEFIKNETMNPEYLLTYISSAKGIFNIYVSFSNILINSLFLFTIYRFLPSKKLDIKSLIKGSLLASIIYEIVKALFSYYITQINDYTSIFGSLSTIVIFMIWIWFACAIFVFGAEACYVFYRNRKTKTSES